MYRTHEGTIWCIQYMQDMQALYNESCARTWHDSQGYLLVAMVYLFLECLQLTAVCLLNGTTECACAMIATCTSERCQAVKDRNASLKRSIFIAQWQHHDNCF